MKVRVKVRVRVRAEVRAHLGREPLHVVLFCLQLGRGHEHGEVTVLHANRFDLGVQIFSNCIPNRIRPRSQNVATGDVIELDHLTLEDDLLVPLWEVALLGVLETLAVGTLHLARGALGRYGQLGSWCLGWRRGTAAGGRGDGSGRKIDHERVVVIVIGELPNKRAWSGLGSSW